jgi:hypothetical protein
MTAKHDRDECVEFVLWCEARGIFLRFDPELAPKLGSQDPGERARLEEHLADIERWSWTGLAADDEVEFLTRLQSYIIEMATRYGIGPALTVHANLHSDGTASMRGDGSGIEH